MIVIAIISEIGITRKIIAFLLLLDLWCL